MPHPADRLSRPPAGFTPVVPCTPRVPLDRQRIIPDMNPHAHRWWRWGWLVLVLLLILAGALAWQSGGRDRLYLRPQARTQALLDAAAAALQRGQLSAADGSGARQLYAAVLALDPDEPRARRGLVATGRAALEAARQALAREDMASAQELLQLARDMQVPRAELDAVAVAAREAARTQTPPDALLERAEAARSIGQDATALALYRDILTLQPDHATTLRKRDETLAALLDGARAQARAGDLEAATAAVALARRFDPGHADLPDTAARLTEERTALHDQAGAALTAGDTAAALAIWQRLLALDAGDSQAREGIARAAQALAEHAATLAGQARFAEADALIAQARTLAPDAPATRAAELRITRARTQQPGTTRSADVQALGECFDASLTANDLRRAGDCLNKASVLGEDVAILTARRRALALHWLAIAEERLGRAEPAAAAAALDNARASDPATPGLDAFAHRLAAATP